MTDDARILRFEEHLDPTAILLPISFALKCPIKNSTSLRVLDEKKRNILTGNPLYKQIERIPSLR
jgi:hypothetical protein